jgi:MbtH protein
MSENPDKRVRQDAPGHSLPTFHVVINSEEQYSICDTRRAIPAGWTATGFEGPESACLDHIDSVWTDIRPLSLRAKELDA